MVYVLEELVSIAVNFDDCRNLSSGQLLSQDVAAENTGSVHYRGSDVSECFSN